MNIEKNILFQTTGDKNSVSQVFYNNAFVKINQGAQNFIEFKLPMFITFGGTQDYYGQSVHSIFTNLTRPFFRFYFTANTQSFSSTTFLIHDVYRLDYKTFSNFQPSFVPSVAGMETDNNTTTETSTTNVDGVISTSTTRKVTSIINNKNTFQDLGFTSLNDIQSSLSNPIFSLTAVTSGIVEHIYDFYPDEYVKNIGTFKAQLFQDKSQYFIDTKIKFLIQKDPTLLDYDFFSTSGSNPYVIIQSDYNATDTVVTDNSRSIINQGQFQGLNVVGNFFTYFFVPNKPKIEYPVVTGPLSTFTPTFYFSSVEDGDEYLLQVNYNTGDTGFTGTFFSYPIIKDDKFKEQSVDKQVNPVSEFTTSKTIRRYETSIKSNSNFLYRVGNVKSIVNLFGVKQSVVTFSDNFMATTPSNPISVYVMAESDSPYSPTIAGFTTPPSIENGRI
jgi:hypothetical protein